MPFSANFFDGKTSRTHKAAIYVSSLNWRISYIDENNRPIDTSWKSENIKKADVYTNGLVSFTYGDTFPFQKIESSDAAFIDYVNNSEHNNLNNSLDLLLHKSKNKSLVVLLLTLVGLAIITYFYIIPAVATGFVSSLSKESVINFGDYIFRVVTTDLEINEEASEKLQDFVDEMEIESSFPLQVYVAESSEMNAFALSGGKIIIYSSLLEKIENEAQLSALIGHEVSHIENRHVLKNLARNFGGAIFVSVLFGDVNGATTVLQDNAHMFSQLSYTRSLEKEADIFGLDIMRNNDVDLHGMPQLFEILQRETPMDVPTYLSNHPMLKDRIDYTKQIASEQKAVLFNSILSKKWSMIQQVL
jgi:Zn-dependent protease with chaperone function